MKLLIRNLARTTTEKELRLLFEAHGTVHSCTLVTDKTTGGSKGFGFVEMSGPGESRAAIKKLNGKDVAGSRIRVKEAKQKPGSNSRNKGKQQADRPKKN
jgi:RNA recognition motif-containing protein